MAFSSGFSAGLQLGNNIKRNKLDREMLDWRKQQAADELAFNKGVADARAEAVGADLKLRQEDLADRKANTAADNARLDADSSWRRQSAIMGGINSALGGARQNREYAAQIKALKAGGGASAKPQAYRTVRRSDPDTGEEITERYPIAVPEQGEMAQTQPTAAAEMDPVAATAAAEIKQRQQNIANMKVRKATEGNGGFFGFNTWQDDIDDEQAAIDRLQPLVGSPAQAQQAPSAPQAAPRQLPPAIQQQYDAQMAAPQKNPEAGAAPTGVRMLAPGGQVGMIPADQVEAALKKGYRRG